MKSAQSSLATPRYNVTEHPLVVKFRKELLGRGTAGIKNISVYFRQIDADGNKKLDFDEFQQGIMYHNITLNKKEIAELFKIFDRDGNGTLDFNEFLLSIRPPLNSNRISIIHKAFQKLDKNKDRVITIEDLRGVYNVKYHPKYLSGEWSEDQCLRKFLDQFEIGEHKDGVITFDEFVQYYAGVSASVDSDVSFDFIMRQAWRL